MRRIPDLTEDEWLLVCDILSNWVRPNMHIEITPEVQAVYDKIAHAKEIGDNWGVKPMRRGRHAKSSQDDWGAEPSRSTELAEAVAEQHPEPVVAKKAPAKKDTTTWCKGKVGREHKLIVGPSKYWWMRGECCWGSSLALSDGRIKWVCKHQEHCSVCGKIMRDPWELRPEECPIYPGSEEQKAAAEAKRVATRERMVARKSRRKIITGPTHYRKKKKATS